MAVELKPIAPKDAIAAYEARRGKLTESFSWQELFEAEHATQMTVAKSVGFDVMVDIDAAMSKALNEGRTLRDFSKELQPLLEAKGWWGKKLVTDPLTGDLKVAQLGSAKHLETIFNINMRVSYAAGHWASFERNKASRPFLRYVTMRDDHVRPLHAKRHNLVLPVDHPYWNLWAPPCGWGCRCTLQSLSQRDIDRLQREGEALFFEPPEDTWRSFVNKRTGEITRVPDGIDPGWAYNPGKAGYQAAVNRALSEKVAGAPPQFVAAAVDDRLQSAAFAQFITSEAEGSMPVMAVPAEISAATKSEARVALLSSETMIKQRRHHPELTLEDYRVIPSIGDNPTLIAQDGENTFVLVKLTDGRWRYLAMKTTATGKAAFVTSYRFASDDNIARLLDRPGIRILVDKRGK